MGVTALATRGLPKPRNRTRSEDCDGSAIEDVARTAQEVASTRAALVKVAADLLPGPIAAALSRQAQDVRLLVLPISGISEVPFAALPLHGGEVIDKFAVTIVNDIFSLGIEASPGWDVTRPPGAFDNLTPEERTRELVNGSLWGLSSLPNPTDNSEPDHENQAGPDAGGTNGSQPDSAQPKNEDHNKYGNTLIVADPDLSDAPDFCWPKLRHAASEGMYVATAFNDKMPLIGPQATFTNVINRLISDGESLEFIYFATHGMADEVNPADMGFVALKEKNLTGAAIRDLHLYGSPLVVLSACETSLGKTFSQGVFGLAKEWTLHGANNVVTSLWDVNDSSTEKLMHYFVDHVQERFRRSNKYGKDSDVALAEAMRDFKKVNNDPILWGAFQHFSVPEHPFEDSIIRDF
jgi:hypothetical protein